MKFIKLLTSAYVGGGLRHPDEGVLHVSDEDAKRILAEEAGVDVTADFTDEQNEETATEAISAAAPETAPAASEPHQSEVAPQAAAAKPKAARKGASTKE
jgi:hypothetical protein